MTKLLQRLKGLMNFCLLTRRMRWPRSTVGCDETLRPRILLRRAAAPQSRQGGALTRATRMTSASLRLLVS